MAQQNNRCAVCRIDLTSLASKDVCLDHDHKTGHVRSVLCRHCNGLEGKVFNIANRGKRDGTPLNFLIRLVEYWKFWNDNPSNVYHPTHKTDDEKRLLRNKRARVARAKKKV